MSVIHRCKPQRTQSEQGHYLFCVLCASVANRFFIEQWDEYGT